MADLKIPPHSEEAERGTLGSILLDHDAIFRCDISPDAFYDRRHQTLFAELSEMSNANLPMDAISIGEWLKKRGVLDKVGGYDYLIELQDATLVPSHIKFYADTVKEKKLLRDIIQRSSEATDLAYRGDTDGVEIVSKFGADMLDLSMMEHESLDIAEHARAFVGECERGDVGHFPFWCGAWTEKLGRLSNEIVLFHARRSTGKTALMIQWMIHSHMGGKVAPLWTIETPKKNLAPRFIANVGGINTFTMRTRGHITADERERSLAAIEKILASKGSS